MDKSQKAASPFIVASSNTAKLFQFQKECFHQMSFLIEPPIHIPRIRIIALGWNAEISAMISDILSQRPLSVSFVSQYSHSRTKLDCFQHLLSNLHVMHVSGGQLDMNRIAQGIHNGVNLGTSAASTDPNTLIFLILLAGIFFILYGFREPLLSAPALALCALM